MTYTQWVGLGGTGNCVHAADTRVIVSVSTQSHAGICWSPARAAYVSRARRTPSTIPSSSALSTSTYSRFTCKRPPRDARLGEGGSATCGGGVSPACAASRAHMPSHVGDRRAAPRRGAYRCPTLPSDPSMTQPHYVLLLTNYLLDSRIIQSSRAPTN